MQGEHRTAGDRFAPDFFQSTFRSLAEIGWAVSSRARRTTARQLARSKTFVASSSMLRASALVFLGRLKSRITSACRASDRSP